MSALLRMFGCPVIISDFAMVVISGGQYTLNAFAPTGLPIETAASKSIKRHVESSIHTALSGLKSA
eukprot:10951181-Ditylum_brightwellii.AAC.1